MKQILAILTLAFCVALEAATVDPQARFPGVSVDGPFAISITTNLIVSAGTNNINTFRQGVIRLQSNTSANNAFLALNTGAYLEEELILQNSDTGNGFTLKNKSLQWDDSSYFVYLWNGDWVSTNENDTLVLLWTPRGWTEFNRFSGNTNQSGGDSLWYEDPVGIYRPTLAQNGLIANNIASGQSLTTYGSLVMLSYTNNLINGTNQVPLSSKGLVRLSSANSDPTAVILSLGSPASEACLVVLENAVSASGFTLPNGSTLYNSPGSFVTLRGGDWVSTNQGDGIILIGGPSGVQEVGRWTTNATVVTGDTLWKLTNSVMSNAKDFLDLNIYTNGNRVFSFRTQTNQPTFQIYNPNGGSMSLNTFPGLSAINGDGALEIGASPSVSLVFIDNNGFTVMSNSAVTLFVDKDSGYTNFPAGTAALLNNGKYGTVSGADSIWQTNSVGAVQLKDRTNIFVISPSGNIGTPLTAGSTTVVDMQLAEATNTLSGDLVFTHATNGTPNRGWTAVRTFANASGANHTVTVPAAWANIGGFPNPFTVTNGMTVKLYVHSTDDTTSNQACVNAELSAAYAPGGFLPLSGGTLTGTLEAPQVDSGILVLSNMVANVVPVMDGASPPTMVPSRTSTNDLDAIQGKATILGHYMGTDTNALLSALGGVAKAGSTMTGTLVAPEVDAAELYTGSFKLYRSALTPIDAGTQLDFGSTNRYWSCSLTGAVTFTTANLVAGKHANIMITGVATNAAFTWPANWIFIGYKPTYLTANKHADIYLKSTGTTDAGVWAYYGEEQ